MTNAPDEGYVNYFEILGVDQESKPGEVRKEYRRKMKDLVNEINSVEITESRRARFLLEMAKLNAALFLLRETDLREAFWKERAALIDLEARWRAADDTDPRQADRLRGEFDGRVRTFLSKYLEELMLGAGRDKECVEASGWDEAHERHASRIIRQYRHTLYHKILERLPFADVTRPQIDWDERRATVSSLISQGTL